jgi:hypothetical protein
VQGKRISEPDEPGRSRKRQDAQEQRDEVDHCRGNLQTKQDPAAPRSGFRRWRLPTDDAIIEGNSNTGQAAFMASLFSSGRCHLEYLCPASI